MYRETYNLSVAKASRDPALMNIAIDKCKDRLLQLWLRKNRNLEDVAEEKDLRKALKWANPG